MLLLPVPWGALVNAGAVLLGSLAGLLLHRSLPPKLRQAAFVAVGLSTILIGLQMALAARSLLPVIFSMIIGAVIGEALGLHERLEGLSERLRRRISTMRRGPAGEPAANASAQIETAPAAHSFSEGLLTAFLVFCVGSMTIVGSFNEGISGDASLIYAKSLLDGFTSIALASTYGIGVLFSIVPLLILQVGLTWLGAALGSSVPKEIISQLTAVGGLLVLALGLNLLEIRSIKVSNLLPALLVIVLIEYLLRLF